jgi:exosome complex component MTR3
VEKALHDAIRFETFPKAVLEVYILVLENDGGDFEAAITCASAAIADAGVEMYDLVTAVAVGLNQNDEIVLDPKSEDALHMKAVASIGFIASSQKITHVNMVGRTDENTTKLMMESCLDGCAQLSSVVRTILTS